MKIHNILDYTKDLIIRVKRTQEITKEQEKVIIDKLYELYEYLRIEDYNNLIKFRECESNKE
jgi:hypothetical protein